MYIYVHVNIRTIAKNLKLTPHTIQNLAYEVTVAVYLESLWDICDSDVIVSLSEEAPLQLTGFIHIVDAGLLLGLAKFPPSSSLTPSLLLLFTFLLLLLLTTQILDTCRRVQYTCMLYLVISSWAPQLIFN